MEYGGIPSDDSFAQALRGFGPIGIIAILIIFLSGNVFISTIVVPLGGILVVLWIRFSHTPWREIGFVRPKNWIVTVAFGHAFGITFKLIMKAIVMPLLKADPINQSYHYLAGNTAMLPAAIWAMFVAGFAEETVFRGYMFERFGKLFGSGVWSKLFIVLITSILFGLSHYRNQGFTGVEHATIFGLVFGTIFAITSRIWLLIVAHVAFDLAALAIIYWDFEYEVAHLIFK